MAHDGVEVAEEGLARFFEVVLPHLNEVQRRVATGAAAEMFGRGGESAVAHASGMSRTTVIKAEREVRGGIEPTQRLRTWAVATSRSSRSSRASWRRSTSWSAP
ncbi:MAG: hypothetical protein ACYCU7_16375 [Acidimicrobiales bacterium]